MEDKSMKFTKLTILVSSFLLLFSLSSAGEKAVKKDHLLSISPNIKNEKLRAELEILMTDFDTERQTIQDYYTKEIEKLKKERKLEVKAIKKEFGEKREALIIQYGEDRKVMHSKPERSNSPDKKVGKNKKSIQKPK